MADKSGSAAHKRERRRSSIGWRSSNRIVVNANSSLWRAVVATMTWVESNVDAQVYIVPTKDDKPANPLSLLANHKSKQSSATRWNFALSKKGRKKREEKKEKKEKGKGKREKGKGKREKGKENDAIILFPTIAEWKVCMQLWTKHAWIVRAQREQRIMYDRIPAQFVESVPGPKTNWKQNMTEIRWNALPDWESDHFPYREG